MMRPPRGLASRLMVAQLLVIATGALTLVVASVLVAPALFSEHLTRTGEESPQVQQHAEQAFASSFAISLAVAMVASLTAAGLVSWFMVRRVARPVVALADAADAVAGGDYSVTVPTGGFGSELTRLSSAFDHMATRLAATDATRTSMLADLAHELRTPLATLEAYIDGMEDQRSKDRQCLLRSDARPSSPPSAAGSRPQRDLCSRRARPQPCPDPARRQRHRS